MANAQREGRIHQRKAVIIPNVPWITEAVDLEKMIRDVSGGRVLNGGIEDDHADAVHNQKKVARYTLDSKKAVDRLIAKSKKGHLFLCGTNLKAEVDVEASRQRDEDDWTRGNITFSADAITQVALTLRHQAIDAPEIDRKGLARLEIDTQNERVIWGYPDTNPESDLCHLFILPFSSITKIDFWQGGFAKGIPVHDAFMGVRIYRLPQTYVFPLSGDIHHQSPKSPYTLEKSSLEFLTDTNAELNKKMDQKFFTDHGAAYPSSQSVFFGSYESSPLQTCDYLTFRMRDKLSKIEKSPLLKILLRYKMVSVHMEREKLHNARPLWLKQFPEWDVDQHSELPFNVRWIACQMLSFGVVSTAGYGHSLLRLIVSAMAQFDQDVVIATLKVMLQKNAAPYLEIESKGVKLFDDELQQDFKKKLSRILPRENSLPDQTARSQLELGISLSEGTDYYMVNELYVTPSKVYCSGPFPRRANRLLRKFHDNARRGAFAVVHFVGESLRPEYTTDTDQVTLPLGHIKVALQDGITYYAEHFEFIIAQPCRRGTPSCWFINTTISTIGGAHIREWLGGFKYFKSAVRCSRTFGLALEPIHGKSWIIKDNEWVVALSDREKMAGHYGLISHSFAKVIAFELGITPTPCSFEVLFRGEHRLLVTYELPESIKLVFPTQSLSPANEMTSVLDVCRTGMFQPGALTRSHIVLLADLGVPRATISSLHKFFVGSILAMTTSRQIALDLLLSESLAVDVNLQRDLAKLLDGGMPFSDDFFREVLRAIQSSVLLESRRTGKLPISKSGKFYQTLDPTRSLKPGEASLTVKRKDPNGSGQWHDVHVYQGVSPPTALRHLDNVLIYCPTEEMNKNQPPSFYFEREWDVEQTTVFWDIDLLPMSRLLPSTRIYWNREEPSEFSIDLKDIQDLFMVSVNSLRQEVALNNYLVYADKENTNSGSCSRLALAAKYASALKLSGKATELPRDLSSRTLPEFLENEEDKRTHTSNKILGELYTDFMSLTATAGQESGAVSSLLDLIRPGHEKYLEEAEVLCKGYSADIESLKFEFGCSEAALYAGTPLSISLLQEDHDARDRLRNSMNILRRRFKMLFDRDPDTQDLFKRLQKISAWHVASRKKGGALSFAWTVPGALRELYTVAAAEAAEKRRRLH